MKTLIVNRNIIVSIIAVMLLIYGLPGISYAQDAPDETLVEFADVNLVKAVREELGLGHGTARGADFFKIPKTELLRLIQLYVGSSDKDAKDKIIDLTGLEHATQLRTLRLRNNQIRDVALLAQLTNLTELNLGFNDIVDVSALAQLTHLTTLDLSSNNIVDVSALAQLTHLTTLDLYWNQIVDFSPLAQLTNLTELNLGFNNIIDVSALAQLTHLTTLATLDLSSNNIVDVSALAQLTNLTKLNLGFNDIVDVSALAQLTNLTKLYLGFNDIVDVAPLAQLANLTTLNLKNNSIVDVAPLANLILLEDLRLRRNPITDRSPLSALLDKNPDLDIDIEVVRVAEVPTVTETSTTDTTVNISPASVASPAIGQQLEIALNIAGGEAIAGYQATVQFDTTALRHVESSNSDFLPDGAFFVPPVVEGNLVKLNAASLAGETSGDGTLATLTFEVIAVKASTLTLSDVLLTNSAGETFVPQVENAEITESTGRKGDVNGDGIVNIADLVLVASNLGKTGQTAADVNGDSVVNIADLVLVAGALGTSAAAPSLNSQLLSTLPAAEVKLWLSQAQHLTLTDTTSQRGILFLEQLLAALTPKETALLANYPNPFNPETWIPYQLTKSADVIITIYAANGQRVRQLALGHQHAGKYHNRSRAAYWDGRNAFGEPVASGVYFYTLIAGDFTATRKMLIRK